MSGTAMRAALLGAREWIASQLHKPEECPTIKQIDEALKSTDEMEHISHRLDNISSILLNRSETRLANQILQLPDQIKEQSQKVADEIFAIEQKRAELAKIKSEIAFDVANDSTLTNEAKRKAAIEQALKVREDYKKLAADLPVFEQQLKRDEIELRYLENLFSAYRSIAGMQGMRL